MSTVLDALPFTWHPTQQWSTVEVDHGCAILQQNGNYMRPPVCHFCGADACYVVSRTSRLTDGRYTDPVCDRHALAWLPQDDGVLCACGSRMLRVAMPATFLCSVCGTIDTRDSIG